MAKLSDELKVLEILNTSPNLRVAANRLDVSTQAIDKWMKKQSVKRICRYIKMTQIDTTAVAIEEQ